MKKRVGTTDGGVDVNADVDEIRFSDVGGVDGGAVSRIPFRGLELKISPGAGRSRARRRLPDVMPAARFSCPECPVI